MSNNISLLDIAKSKSLGIVKAGLNICDIGENLGVPDYWRFGSEEFFSGYMGFGAVEVHFAAEENKVIVHHAHLYLNKFSGRFAKFIRNENGSRVLFEMPVQRRMLTFKFIWETFERSGLDFVGDLREADFTDITAEIKIGSLKFKFMGEEPILFAILSSKFDT